MIDSCIGNMTKFQKELHDHFKMSKLSRGEVILYLKAKCIHIKKEIFMTRKAYAHNILVIFGIKNYILAITPMDEKLKLMVDIKEE